MKEILNSVKKNHLQIEQKITPIFPGEYPWQVAILKKEQYDNVYVCGGSLIDASHILTAAHCIKQYRPEELRIRLGEWDVNNDSEFYPNIEMDSLSINIHPEFYSGNLYNDIAIIKIDGFVDFQRNPHISPICLPDAFQVLLLRSIFPECNLIFPEFCW